MPRFTRTSPAPTVSGGYSALRLHVRADFEETCCHCVVRELHAGGLENFEIDHFRPRSRFPQLVDDFLNLYWSCHPCNHIKGERWPPEALAAQGIGFVDLCVDDFEQHYEEDADGTWKPLTRSAEYTIQHVRLNRGHLKELRVLLRTLRQVVE